MLLGNDAMRSLTRSMLDPPGTTQTLAMRYAEKILIQFRIQVIPSSEVGNGGSASYTQKKIQLYLIYSVFKTSFGPAESQQKIHNPLPPGLRRRKKGHRYDISLSITPTSLKIAEQITVIAKLPVKSMRDCGLWLGPVLGPLATTYLLWPMSLTMYINEPLHLLIAL